MGPMRGWALISGCFLVTVGINCTGPDRLYVDAGDTTSSGGGSTSTSSTSTSTGTGGASSTSSTGGGGGAPPTCADATHACIQAVPSGWIGPVALYQGPSSSSRPPCFGDYDMQVADYQGQIDEGNPTCGCTCNPATGIVCTASAKLCYPGSGMFSCDTPCSGTSKLLAPGQCTSVPFDVSTNISVSDPPPTQAGSCTPSPAKSIPTPTWTVAARACGGATTTPAGCASGEVCAPIAPAQQAICIVSPGDVPCTDPFYANKSTFYDSFADTRDCTTCSCGAATSKCGGSVHLTHGSPSGCSAGMPILDEVKNAGTCGGYNDGFDSGTYLPSPSGTCPPAGGQLTGMVTTSGATTVCCH